MSLIEGRSNQSSDDWGVVIQSVPSRSKKNILKQLEHIFHLDKRDAEQVLANLPLILIDGISFGLAALVKKHFLDLGAVSETTNHEMIKKNCFQIVWPQAPDLAFFMKEQAKSSVVSKPEKKDVSEKTVDASPAQEQRIFEKSPEIPQFEEKSSIEMIPEVPRFEEKLSIEKTAEISPLEEELVIEKIADVPPPPVSRPVSQPSIEDDMPRILEDVLAEHLEPEPSVNDSPRLDVPDENPAPSAPSAIDPSWERRAKELNEKLQRIQDEKAQLHDQHTEAAEKVKSELQQRIEQEKQKSEEIAKAYEDLQRKAGKQEELTREGETWRAQASALSEKLSELESELVRKNASLDESVRERDESAKALASARESFSGVEEKLAAAERDLSEAQEKEKLLNQKISEIRANADVKESEVAAMLQKAGSLENNIIELKAALTSRDAVLAQFERQVLELAGKVAEFEPMRREHAQFLQERNSIRAEYETKLSEQEARLAKLEDDHRRYRSRVDRKNAAATRELGESVRVVDTLRQGLQKLILFLGSEAAVLDTEKKVTLKSPLTRGPSAANP